MVFLLLLILGSIVYTMFFAIDWLRNSVLAGSAGILPAHKPKPRLCGDARVHMSVCL